MSVTFGHKFKKLLPFRLVRATYYACREELARTRLRRNDVALIERYLLSNSVKKLQIGAGSNILDGWLNSDYFPNRKGMIHLDATQRFPFPDCSFDRIFSEHVIEHVPLEGGFVMLTECFRSLKPGGRVRISTPPLKFLLSAYENPLDGLNQSYLNWHFDTYNPDSPAKSPVVLLNDYVRMWGHVFIYDEALLREMMEEVGFQQVTAFELGKSDDPDLRNLENEGRMPPGLLQLTTMSLEGTKPRQ